MGNLRWLIVVAVSCYCVTVNLLKWIGNEIRPGWIWTEFDHEMGSDCLLGLIDWRQDQLDWCRVNDSMMMMLCILCFTTNKLHILDMNTALKSDILIFLSYYHVILCYIVVIWSCLSYHIIFRVWIGLVMLFTVVSTDISYIEIGLQSAQ